MEPFEDGIIKIVANFPVWKTTPANSHTERLPESDDAEPVPEGRTQLEVVDLVRLRAKTLKVIKMHEH